MALPWNDAGGFPSIFVVRIGDKKYLDHSNFRTDSATVTFTQGAVDKFVHFGGFYERF